MVVAVDAHGGDLGTKATVPAVLSALSADTTLQVVLVGQSAAIEPTLHQARDQGVGGRLAIEPAETVLDSDAKPAAVLRRGQGSSLWETVALVSGGRANACVSGGNTGALMAAGVRLVGMLPGIQRPVLMGYMPNAVDYTAVLDLGANLNVNDRQLVQFAVMGAVTAEHVDGRAKPRIGLLNVGHEDGKGHELVRSAHAMLKQTALNYIGFVEGHDLFNGNVDVAVCDGFAGNLVLKSSEGLARMIRSELQAALSDSIGARVGGMLARRRLKAMLARLDPSAHNGAPLLGLRAVVVKSHGNADTAAFARAISEAARAARGGVPNRIERLVQQHHLEV